MALRNQGKYGRKLWETEVFHLQLSYCQLGLELKYLVLFCCIIDSAGAFFKLHASGNLLWLQELLLGSSLVPDCLSTRLSSLGQVLFVCEGLDQQVAAAAHRHHARRYGMSPHS